MSSKAKVKPLSDKELYNAERMFLEYLHRIIHLHATKADHEADEAAFENTKRRIKALHSRVNKSHTRSLSRNKSLQRGINQIRNSLGDRRSTMPINEKGVVHYHVIPYAPTNLVLRKTTIVAFNDKKDFKQSPKAMVHRKSTIRTPLLDWRGTDPFIEDIDCVIPIPLLSGKLGSFSLGSAGQTLLEVGSSVITSVREISPNEKRWFIDAVFKEYKENEIRAHPILKYCSELFWEQSGLLYKEGEHRWEFPNPPPPIPRIDRDEYVRLIRKHMPKLEGVYRPPAPQ